jgi:thiol-disulfide isomerase/thioredoxin
MTIFADILKHQVQMRKTLLGFILLMISVVSAGQSKGGYNIAITMTGLQDSTIFLAYHYGDKQYIKDTVKLDKKGYGIFMDQDPLPQGIYMIVLPGKKYFEILISQDQHFIITCSYKDYFNTLWFSGSEENTSFIEYQRKWSAMQQKAAGITRRIQNNKQNNDSVKLLTARQRLQEEEMKSYLKGVIQDNNNNLLSTLVKALLPLEIPEFTIPAGSPNPDSLKWIRKYIYNKDHFFDNLDLTDERLLRSPILYGRLNTFFTNVVIQYPDSINKEIDKLISKCQSNNRIFQFVSVYLFNHFRESEIMGHDAVMVKIADDIYLSGKADWVTKEFKDDLRKQTDLLRHNLIGMKAENLVMDSFKGIFVSLYDIEKEYTILYFWEPDCGHCKEATPKLKAYYEKARNEGIEVFSVCTTGEKKAWTKYIEDNKLTWINGWDPDRASHFDYYYNVQTTPMIYILNRDKTIIAKKLSVDDIPSFIDSYRKFAR